MEPDFPRIHAPVAGPIGSSAREQLLHSSCHSKIEVGFSPQFELFPGLRHPGTIGADAGIMRIVTFSPFVLFNIAKNHKPCL
jgi:hypothetical protein